MMDAIFKKAFETFPKREMAKMFVDFCFDKYEDYQENVVEVNKQKAKENEELRTLLAEVTERLKKYQ